MTQLDYARDYVMSNSFTSDSWNCLDVNKTNAYEEWIRNNVKGKDVCIFDPQDFLLVHLCCKYEANVTVYHSRTDRYAEKFGSDYNYNYIVANWERDPIPEADIYLHNLFSSHLHGELLWLYERMRHEGLLSKMIPTKISLYDCEINQTKTKVSRLDTSLFDDMSRQYIEDNWPANTTPDYSKLDNTYSHFNRIYEGDLSNLKQDMLIRPDYKQLVWSISFGDSELSFNSFGEGYFRPAKWLEKEPVMNYNVEENISLSRYET